MRGSVFLVLGFLAGFGIERAEFTQGYVVSLSPAATAVEDSDVASEVHAIGEAVANYGQPTEVALLEDPSGVTVGGTPEVDASPSVGEFHVRSNHSAGTTPGLGRRLTEFDDLNDAITEIGATEETLLIDVASSLSGDATVPSNVALVWSGPGNVLTLGTHNLTLNGPIEAGLYQAIDDSGSGSFSLGAYATEYFHVRWMGAEVTDTGTGNQQPAIQRTVNATKGSGVPLYFEGGVYRMETDPIMIDGDVHWIFRGTNSESGKFTTFRQMTAGADVLVIDPAANGKLHVRTDGTLALRGGRYGLKAHGTASGDGLHRTSHLDNIYCLGYTDRGVSLVDFVTTGVTFNHLELLGGGPGAYGLYVTGDNTLNATAFRSVRSTQHAIWAVYLEHTGSTSSMDGISFGTLVMEANDGGGMRAIDVRVVVLGGWVETNGRTTGDADFRIESVNEGIVAGVTVFGYKFSTPHANQSNVRVVIPSGNGTWTETGSNHAEATDLIDANGSGGLTAIMVLAPNDRSSKLPAVSNLHADGSYAIIHPDKIEAGGNMDFILPDLPTSDPGVVGQLWNNDGDVQVSTQHDW